MRYVGQQTEVTIALAGDPRDKHNRDDLRARFDAGYELLYGMRLDDMDVEIVSWRVTARGGESQRRVQVEFSQSNATPKATREVYVDGKTLPIPIYDRTALAANQEIVGPVIVEERETTVFILPGWTLRVDEDGSLIANREGE
jgi:N-methylhydantoinase A